jgi:hypothetical protein
MKENKQVVGNQKVTLLNPEVTGLRDLPKNKKFILPYSPHLRRLVDENEKKKGFSKIEVLHGNAWFSGYISHATLKKNLPLQYV